MLKTYRITPLVFILFLFGFTFITVAPVFAWDKSMGMRHPDRPCMKVNSCGPDDRTDGMKASDPFDKNNPQSVEARANKPLSTPLASTSPSGDQVAQLIEKIYSQGERIRTLERKINDDFGLAGDVQRIWDLLDCKRKGHVYHRHVCNHPNGPHR